MSMINIGNKQSKKIVKDIIAILKAINKNKISDEVGVKALCTYTDIAPIRNVNISDCRFSTVNDDDKDIS